MTGVVPMTVVEALKRLSDARDAGFISTEEFESRRANLLAGVDEAELAAPTPRAKPKALAADPVRPAQEAAFEPGVTLALIALGSALPALLAMLLFNLPAWSGATIFVACLAGVILLWSRALSKGADITLAEEQ